MIRYAIQYWEDTDPWVSQTFYSKKEAVRFYVLEQKTSEEISNIAKELNIDTKHIYDLIWRTRKKEVQIKRVQIKVIK